MAVALVPLLSYSFIGSITPGPNNIMLAASGVNFGFRQTVPHFLGVYFGFLLMLTIACLGLGQIFHHVPILQPIMKYAGSAYLLYLAYRIATSEQVGKAAVGKPLTFFEAALFQYINPKAWIMASTIPAAFTLNEGVSLSDTTFLVGGHALVSLPSILAWVLIGTQLRRLLSTPRSRLLFNMGMATLLVGTVAMILLD
ncbi:LysE family translocator [Sneathiella chinensis]|uniref:Lysine transporter LysE n=1 Tax=Sneathiella chinensis TaxID=349750 RepID=A0ABQ5U5E6_9PROT|nr:LysE family translocator [Sneathiella chinensis]GLQ07342.1 hypothetical protein GCM10007924_25630 [Sneathiella chinensis]